MQEFEKIGQENAENPYSILSDIKKAFVLPPNRGPPHRPTDDEPAIVHLHPFSYFVFWFFSELELGPGLYLTEYREHREIVVQVKEDVLAITAIRDGILFAFVSGVLHFITVLCQYDDTDLDLVNWIKLIVYGAFWTYYVICLAKLLRSAFNFFEKYTDNIAYFTGPHENVAETDAAEKGNEFVTDLDQNEIVV